MLLANTLSEVAVSAMGGTGLALAAAGASGTVPGGAAQCYDRDKQAWAIKADCHSETVRFHMVYKDIHNVPRNHLR